MTNKEFILKLIKYCCFGLLLFAVFMLSFCCGFYYRDSGHTMEVNAQSLQPADTSTPNYTFLSSNFPMLLYEYNGFNDTFILDYFPCVFTLTHSSFKVTYYDSHNQIFNIQGSIQTYNTNIRYDYTHNSYGGSAEYYMSSDFNCNPVRFSVGLLDSFFGDTYSYECYILFVDSNNHTFQFGFRVPKVVNIGGVNYSIVSGRYGFATRTYYLSNSFSDNTFYQSGYDLGYQDGLSAEQSNIYQDGYNTGLNNGQNIGYQQGIEDANQYTFLNLIGAVIDAPITAFVNLLDFNVFGFNMLNLCCSLLTLSLIILVVKFVLFRS